LFVKDELELVHIYKHSLNERKDEGGKMDQKKRERGERGAREKSPWWQALWPKPGVTFWIFKNMELLR
jgi:hypothetical protein